ncbi:putative elongation factor P [Cardiosporidium cionae]|uniref:Elongation factor P n=1 Tax=Cardiosporidium cionae TaxID=476202 RepID=A0ABQ7JC29_9APIC|nr:putative elongation factor P [Cardiosporidium cionae]|eukprot:KAF8821521.1 putative elongation factor P [Cardiosporidium cionae]
MNAFIRTVYPFCNIARNSLSVGQLPSRKRSQLHFWTFLHSRTSLSQLRSLCSTPMARTTSSCISSLLLKCNELHQLALSRSFISTMKAREMCRCTSMRQFSSYSASDLRVGTIFLHNDKYCEVTEVRHLKQGRGVASINVDYIELNAQKSGSHRFPAGNKVEKIEGIKVLCKVLYVDSASETVVVIDESFEQIDIGFAHFGGMQNYLESNMPLNLYFHEDKVIKVVLPSSLLVKRNFTFLNMLFQLEN